QEEKVKGLQGYVDRNQGMPGADPLHEHVTFRGERRSWRKPSTAAATRRTPSKKFSAAALQGSCGLFTVDSGLRRSLPIKPTQGMTRLSSHTLCNHAGALPACFRFCAQRSRAESTLTLALFRTENSRLQRSYWRRPRSWFVLGRRSVPSPKILIPAAERAGRERNLPPDRNAEGH